ncbi:MAG: DUF4440 domain-containing protein [Paracoccaceae bacterium]
MERSPDQTRLLLPPVSSIVAADAAGLAMEQAVRQLFTRYAQFFERALAGAPDGDEIATLYAPEFIAAGPAGVRTGHNDATFRAAMTQGYDHYRAIGTQSMRIRDIRISPIDDLHCIAHVAWRATYARDDLAETAIDFDVHYLVQLQDGAARVFGWVAGDEQAALRARGIL